MRPDPLEIIWLGETYKIRPLTISQHVAIKKVVNNYDKDNPEKADGELLIIALRRDHAALLDSDEEIAVTDLQELFTASHAILRYAGYFKDLGPGEHAAGEAAAAEATG